MMPSHLPLCGIISFVFFPMAVCYKGKEDVSAGAGGLGELSLVTHYPRDRGLGLIVDNFLV